MYWVLYSQLIFTYVLPEYTTDILLMVSDCVDNQTNQDIFNIAFKFIDESVRFFTRFAFYIARHQQSLIIFFIPYCVLEIWIVLKPNYIHVISDLICIDHG